MEANTPSTKANNPLPNKQRYNALDALKCICAFCVITIHVPFRGNISIYCDAIARMAVPIFFMISGFFMEERFSKSSLPCPTKTIIKLLKLIFWSNLLYFVWGILFFHFYQNSMTISDLLLYITGGENWQNKIKNYLLYHSDLVYYGYHLWYLNALLYAWTIVYCIKYFFKEKGTKLLHLLIPLLIAYSVIYSNYSFVLFGKFNTLTSRNYLFCGIPYIALGSWIYQKQKPLCQLFSKKGLFTLLIVLCAAICLERYVLSLVYTSRPADYYICTTFQAITAFLLFLKIHSDHPETRWLKPLAKIGNRHSLYIYILHPIFYLIIWNLLVLFKIDHIYNLVNFEPVLIFFVTLVASELLIRILHITPLSR